MKNKSLYDVLTESVLENKKRSFVFHKGFNSTYLDFLKRTRARIDGLNRWGVMSGSLCGVISLWSIDLLELYFAFSAIGVTYIPIGINCNIKQLLDDVIPDYLFLAKGSSMQQIEDLLKEENYSYFAEDEKWILFKSCMLCDQIKSVVPDRVVLVRTSGSTGLPKFVLLKDSNLLFNAEAVVKRMGFSANDTFLGSPAPFSMFGIAEPLMTILSGAKLILTEKYSPQLTFSLIEREKVTIHNGSWGTFLLELAECRFSKSNFTSLRSGIIGGAVINEQIICSVREEMGLNLSNCYGMTEASGAISMRKPFDRNSVNTVGFPLDDVSVRVSDKYGNTQSIGLPGEIECKSPSLPGVYLSKRQRIKLLVNGWFQTGDYGLFLQNGCLKVLGRKGDSILRFGKRVWLSQIEESVTSCPSVAYAVAVKTKNYPEKVYAFVIRKPDNTMSAKRMLEYCKAEIDHSLCPDKIIILEKFPLTESGKVDKNILMKIISFGL